MVPTIMLYIAGNPIFHRINRNKNKYYQSNINDAFYEMVKSQANFTLPEEADILREQSEWNHVCLLGDYLRVDHVITT